MSQTPQAEGTPNKNRYGMSILLDEEQLAQATERMGREITAAYKDLDLTIVGTLKGCFMFMADLVRHIHVPMNVEFIEVSSYGNDTSSSGIVKITKDLKYSMENQHVLLVEDIIDTGITLNYLVENFMLRKPASVRIASLLVKDQKQRMQHPIDFRGFNIEDKFVIGYGMDYAGKFRNLPHVAFLESDDQLPLFSSD